MKLKEKIKTYNFWVSISSAIFLIVNLIGKKYNFVVDESWLHDIITSIFSIGSKLTWAAGIGMAVVASGCFILPQKSFREFNFKHFIKHTLELFQTSIF